MDDIWGATAGQQALFGVLMLLGSAALWIRLAPHYGDGLWGRYARFVAAPACVLLGLAALLVSVL